MLFNSVTFAIFFTIVFLLYWLIFNRTVLLRNSFLLIVSYVFYGWWDWRFLLLIAASSLVDYCVGIALEKSAHQHTRKWLLLVSIVVNVGILFVFKYFGFFVDSFISVLEMSGIAWNMKTLEFLLPVGISFYTLQTMSYTIDIYRGVISPTRNIVAFFAFVAFFPQLVAGPIERAKNLLPQFLEWRRFRYEDGVAGVKQIAWGLFKKIAIADVLAPHVDWIFSSPETMPTSTLFIGAVYFAIQVYADFSGYSDIAIGVARMLGFRLMVNFKYPFFARDIAELWRRWHISLTTWFRDYVYVPMGGSRVGGMRKYYNIVVVFVLSGLWHGAALTYILWGFISSLTYIPLLLAKRNRAHLNTVAEGRVLPTAKQVFQMIGAFLLFALPLIMFRSESVRDALIYYERLFTGFTFSVESFVLTPVYGIIILFSLEWCARLKAHPLELKVRNTFLRKSFYFFICFYTLVHISNEANPFIYFQF